MEIAALVLGAAGLVAAFAAPGTIEVLKRPRLEIVPSPWVPEGPVAWTFATVQIRNKPITAPLVKRLTREAAQGCVVDIDFFRWGTEDKVFPTVPGRWSSHPEPIRSQPSPPANVGTFRAGSPVTGGTASTATSSSEPGFSFVYDPTLDPRQHDVATSEAGRKSPSRSLRQARRSRGQRSHTTTSGGATPSGAWSAVHTALLYVFAAQA
jgi:hypothetical protein